ncbi:MAG: ssDNA endonuclease and repair protein rad10 [Vezdaea aestivalis]|nr:MAG: ssDNA endonuclease and repair protein rad10 [Vezdaea aestivalis]
MDDFDIDENDLFQSDAFPAPQSAPRASHTTSAPPRPSASSTAPKVQQPTPQALPARPGTAKILVASSQNGNPVLSHIKQQAWEYADIPADFVVGATTCAFFLSLRYHKLHPEYVYGRVRDLGPHRYNLRILLVVVDIPAHEESLQELSKTCVVNNLTLILSWSAAEAARYLELYKLLEHTPPTAIREHQTTAYADKVKEFVTVPRAINKQNAIDMLHHFGSVRAAVNAGPAEVLEVPGWGDKKTSQWCKTVRAPFRLEKASKRGAVVSISDNSAERAEAAVGREVQTRREAPIVANDMDQRGNGGLDRLTGDEVRPTARRPAPSGGPSAAAPPPASRPAPPTPSSTDPQPRRPLSADEELDDGVGAALAALRKRR